MLAAFERGVTDKLLFASGFPNETPERAIERMYTVNSVRNGTHLPGIPRETVRGIVERDSLRLLGIEHVGPMKAPAPASNPKSAASDPSSRSGAR
jgi:predicted TIM-barrel fold metal-dependent hydrolase